MSERLQKIKALGYVDPAEVDWLIGEVERLRAALQQLYDATEFAIVDPLVPDMAGESFWRAVDAFDDARDVAAGLLTDPATELTGANLRDSGMGEAGGVSDGPQ